MGKMKEIDIKLQEAQERAGDEKAERGAGGRPRLDMETLLETEEAIADLGHYGAAKALGICYHSVRYRMRRLYKLRGEAV